MGSTRCSIIGRDRSERISRTWDEYQDNRYYTMKLRYFFELDRDHGRPLVLCGSRTQCERIWQNSCLRKTKRFNWVCDNPKKIGLDVYDIRMHGVNSILDLESPQIVVAVASPEGQDEILSCLTKPINDQALTIGSSNPLDKANLNHDLIAPINNFVGWIVPHEGDLTLGLISFTLEGF